jgi:hypothetical protein
MPAHLHGKPQGEVDQERIISALERMVVLLAQIARGVDRLVEAQAKPEFTRDDYLDQGDQV